MERNLEGNLQGNLQGNLEGYLESTWGTLVGEIRDHLGVWGALGSREHLQGYMRGAHVSYSLSISLSSLHICG